MDFYDQLGHQALEAAVNGLHQRRPSCPEAADPTCVFCDIIAGHAPRELVAEWPEGIAIRPDKPKTKGHLLIIARDHIPHASADPAMYGRLSAWAAYCAIGVPSYNIITSAGTPATQSIRHLHLHLVPRTEGDGVALAWGPGWPDPPDPQGEQP